MQTKCCALASLPPFLLNPYHQGCIFISNILFESPFGDLVHKCSSTTTKESQGPPLWILVLSRLPRMDPIDLQTFHDVLDRHALVDI